LRYHVYFTLCEHGVTLSAEEATYCDTG